MKFRYKIISVLLVAFAAATLFSCGRQGRTYRIGVSQCSDDDWRSKMNEEMQREIMFHPDAELEIRSANDSNEKQIADIQYFLDNRFDIIIAAPNEADAITPIVKKAYESGTPVIVFDRNINGPYYTAYQGVDNTELGRMAARYARHLVGPEARVLEIYGNPGSTPAVQRHLGFAEVLSRYPGIKVAATASGDWDYEDASRAADSILRLHPEIDLIYAHNDRMAIGASEVARRRGLSPKVIGIDAAPAIGIRAVADSVIDATFLYPTEGNRLIRTALNILHGEPYDTVTLIPIPSAVDLTNADILLQQNEAISDGTSKMRYLKGQVDEYWERHSAQSFLFYCAIAIAVLLFFTLFLLLRAFWQRKRHQETLMRQNRLLQEQRDLQESLNRQLQEATQAKLIFYTSVSHDLRTPLTLISEPVEQLAQASNLTPQQHTLMLLARKNVKILHRLINQILDFRKYESGKLELNRRKADLGALLREWTESFGEAARRRHIRLETAVEPTGIVEVDTEKLERVVFNLLSNAMKFTPDNGRVALTCLRQNENLVITVEDSGRGIAADDLPNVFERFWQADKVHPEGSGIGLSLVKSFVEMHSGEITAESEPGKGTRFRIMLPAPMLADGETPDELRHASADVVSPEILDIVTAAPQPESEVDDDAAGSGDEPSGDKPILLVIDDNADLRSLIASMMAPDYTVIAAPDGRRGLRMAARYVPDLIVCDVMMPVMDGLECCRRLKQEVSTCHIPVLLLTACSLDEQRAQGYRSGADGYLSKPFNGEVLRARCQGLVENRRRIKELWQGDGMAPSLAAAPVKASLPVTSPEEDGAGAADLDNEFYRRLREVFDREMGNPGLNVDALASMMGLGRSQFYRKIKSMTNCSPVELLRRLRLQRARQLLTTTDRTVGEIAYEVGFSTPAYFTKCYRDEFGQTPSELRENLGVRQ